MQVCEKFYTNLAGSTCHFSSAMSDARSGSNPVSIGPGTTLSFNTQTRQTHKHKHMSVRVTFAAEPCMIRLSILADSEHVHGHELLLGIDRQVRAADLHSSDITGRCRTSVTTD